MLRDAWLIVKFASVLDEAGLQSLHNCLSIFSKAGAQLTHGGAEAAKLDPPQAATDAWSRSAAVRQVMSTETSSASRTGLCQGSTITIDPSFTCFVRAAMYVKNCATLGHIV